MTDTWEEADRFAEMEAIIRAAADYVHVTDDLRPRVIEGSKGTVRELQAVRRCILALVAVVFLAAWPVSGVQLSPGSSPAWTEAADDSLIHADSSQLWTAAAHAQGDQAWAFVDAFCLMRAQRSAALRDAL